MTIYSIEKCKSIAPPPPKQLHPFHGKQKNKHAQPIKPKRGIQFYEKKNCLKCLLIGNSRNSSLLFQNRCRRCGHSLLYRVWERVYLCVCVCSTICILQMLSVYCTIFLLFRICNWNRFADMYFWITSNRILREPDRTRAAGGGAWDWSETGLGYFQWSDQMIGVIKSGNQKREKTRKWQLESLVWIREILHMGDDDDLYGERPPIRTHLNQPTQGKDGSFN